MRPRTLSASGIGDITCDTITFGTATATSSKLDLNASVSTDATSTDGKATSQGDVVAGGGDISHNTIRFL